MTYARDTLANLQRLWTRPVHIETVLEGRHDTCRLTVANTRQRKTEKQSHDPEGSTSTIASASLALSQRRTPGSRRRQFPKKLRCQLVALRYDSCALSDWQQAESLSTISIDELKAKAEQLSARLTYLLEPISPIEIDSEGASSNCGQIRPRKKQMMRLLRSCFALAVKSVSADTRVGQKRMLLPAQVTREVLVPN